LGGEISAFILGGNTMARMSKTTDEHYVDNVKFYEAMVERTQAVNLLLEANGLKVEREYRTASLRTYKDAKKPLPVISEYIGSCVLKIAQRLLYHPWFSGYTDSWKEDMLGDGLENVINYLDNYNPEITKNPFAYYTQIIWYAFRRRIEKEKKQSYVKAKAVQMSQIYDNNTTQDADDKVYKNDTIKFMQQNMGATITAFEDKKDKNKAKKPAKVKKQNKMATLLFPEVESDNLDAVIDDLNYQIEINDTEVN
jgi:hypothetical protein